MNKFIGITLAVMTAAIAGTFTHTAFAQLQMPGINIPQITIQSHLCSSAGGLGAITGGACSASSTQEAINSGGVATGTGTGGGISLSQGTQQTTGCTSVGGSSPISGGSCSSTSTNTADNSGGVNH